MKSSKFTEAQIAFVLAQAEDGIAVAEVAARRAYRTGRSTIGARSTPASREWAALQAGHDEMRTRRSQLGV